MLESNKITLYNASAGSGKTYTLVKEFLSILLLKPDPKFFKQLLAITFTNKAANEMKERIVEKLQELTQVENVDERESWAKDLDLEPEIVLERSQKILSSILHHYGLFSVSTIDKFNLRLMRAFSQDLGISVNFDVEMDTDKMLQDSVELLFSELQDEDLLSEIITEIAKENLSNDERWDISKDIGSKAEDLIKDKYLESLQQLQKVSLEDFNEYRRDVFKNYFQSTRNIEKARQDVLDYAKRLGLSNDDFKGKSRGVLNYFNTETRKYKFFSDTQQKMWDDGTYCTNKNINLDALTEVISKAYNDISENIAAYYYWSTLKNDINPITFINEVEKRLNKIKEDNNFLLIGDFNKIISDNIKDQPTPFIYEKIGNRYRHFFIDEFQDTSDLQWNNLFPLVENALSEDQTVMLVGDPKQAIYRFRGGNPKLMIALSEMQDPRIVKRNLDTNYRSYSEIIHFNNAFYQTLSENLHQVSYKKLYREAEQKTNLKTGGFIQMHFINPKKEGEINYLAKCMQQLIEDIQLAEENGFTWNEMAILVRQKSESREIAEFLAKNGYQTISSDSLLLKNSSEVQLLISFIQYLNQSNSLVNRANFMMNLFHNQVIQHEDETQFQLENLACSDKDFLKNLKENQVDLGFLELAYQSFYDQISAAIRAFHLDEKADAYLTFFMDEVLKFQNKNDVSPQAFLEFWEQKYPNLSLVIPEGQNAIQLMTIHASKGLQFPVVFLPNLSFEAKSDGVWLPTTNDKVQEVYTKGIKGKDFLPLPIQTLIEEEEMQAEIDEINLMYVATTRAVEQLYINTKENQKKGLAEFHQRFAQSYASFENGILSFGSPERKSEKKLKDLSNQVEIPFISSDWTKKIKVSNEHALLWNDTRADAIEYGKKMHAVLEKIDAIDDTKYVLENFELQGFIDSNDKIRIEEGLLKLFQHPRLSAIFHASESYNERDFIAKDGSLFRPDRLVKLNNQWFLLDYKTGDPHSKYEKQLNDYAQNLNDLGMPIAKKYLIYLNNENLVIEVD